MQIVRIRSRVVDLPLPAPFHPAWARGRNQPNILMVLVEVDTDAGITGYGAAHAGPEAAICIERFVAPYFLGQDPTRVERLAAVLRDAEILGCLRLQVFRDDTNQPQAAIHHANHLGHSGVQGRNYFSPRPSI